jgi:hypothetical protein
MLQGERDKRQGRPPALKAEEVADLAILVRGLLSNSIHPTIADCIDILAMQTAKTVAPSTMSRVLRK